MPEAPHEAEHRPPPVNERGRAYDPDTTDDERTYALFMHLSLMAHLVLTFFAIAIPIVMWQTKKESSPFLDDHGREALNFQISILIWAIVLPILVAIVGVLTCGIGLILLIPAALLPYILGLIGMIQAAMAANRGEFYRYPMTFRFV
jgi:uncharacterized Tic20 family protein